MHRCGKHPQLANCWTNRSESSVRLCETFSSDAGNGLRQYFEVNERPPRMVHQACRVRGSMQMWAACKSSMLASCHSYGAENRTQCGAYQLNSPQISYRDFGQAQEPPTYSGLTATPEQQSCYSRAYSLIKPLNCESTGLPLTRTLPWQGPRVPGEPGLSSGKRS